MEIIIRNITVFIFIKLSEYLEELYLTVEDLIFHLVEECSHSLSVDFSFSYAFRVNISIEVLWWSIRPLPC